MSDRECFVFQARLAEQAERFEEMVEAMKQAVILGPELTVEERNLLSVGYKNVIGTRRASWRIVASFEHKEETAGNADMVPIVRQYRLKIEEELRTICADVLVLLEEQLVPNAGSSEPKVFYLKMMGDYNRYLAEFANAEERKEAAEKALSAYDAASQVAVQELASIHPIRLGLALNYSVFQCEIMSNPEQACKVAKTAFDEAIAELDTLSEESYKDSTLIMQLLRDNLTLWTAESGRAEYVDGDMLDDGAEEAAVPQVNEPAAEPAAAAAQ